MNLTGDIFIKCVQKCVQFSLNCYLLRFASGVKNTNYQHITPAKVFNKK